MNRELVVNSTPKGVEIALLEDKRLVELQREGTNDQFAVGDLYLGKITKVVPGLNAAFVNVGFEKDAFLHYTDLGPTIRSLMKFTRSAIAGNRKTPMLEGFKFEPEILKGGKIKEVLQSRQSILVQIMKEPISTKGPRLSCELSIAGRYLVLTPFNDSIGISKKIADSEERKRLQRLIESIRPKNFGVVIRTVAEKKTVQQLHEDLESLVERWKMMVTNLKAAYPPKKVLGEIDKTSSIVRDLLNDSFNKIVTNDPALQSEISNYIGKIAPEKQNIVQNHKSKTALFDSFGINKQIKVLFGKTVSMAGGAYLVIEHTEALHVIDVNSGHKVSKANNQEEVAISVNLESAKEIARQLRLRDIGGIIVVDFIDMRSTDNKKRLYQSMRDAMSLDRAKHKVLPLSRFGLLQITRQRVRPELTITTTENCPACNGSGKIEASILVIDQIENTLEYLLANRKTVTIETHPFIDAFIRKGFPSMRMDWFFKYKKWIKIDANTNFALTQYKFYDEGGEEINLES